MHLKKEKKKRVKSRTSFINFGPFLVKVVLFLLPSYIIILTGLATSSQLNIALTKLVCSVYKMKITGTIFELCPFSFVYWENP